MLPLVIHPRCWPLAQWFVLSTVVLPIDVDGVSMLVTSARDDDVMNERVLTRVRLGIDTVLFVCALIPARR